MSKHIFSRRDFIKAAMISGGSAFLPFGNISAFAAANGKAPLRFIQIMSNYSVYAPNFWPKISPTTQVAAGVKSLSLSSLTNAQVSANLQPFANANLLSKISLIRGTTVFTYHDHNQSVASTASGQTGSESATFPFSVDAVLSRATATYESEPMFRSLAISPAMTAAGSNLNFSIYDGRKPTTIWQTSQLMDLIFGDDSAAGIQKTATRTKIIDHVQKRYLAIAKQTNVGAEDAKRVSLVSDLLSDIRRRMTKSGSTCVKSSLIAEANTNDVFQNQARVIAAALACDQTRVISMNISTPPSQATDDLHEAHHQAGAGNNFATILTNAKTNYYSRVAFLLSTLASTPDIDGRSVLDNTIVLVANEYGGYGFRAHSFSDMPIMIAGGTDHFRNGEYIDYRLDQNAEEAPGRLYNNLLVSIFNAFGVGSSEYERRGLVGFGDYRGVKEILQNHASNANRRNPLDYVYKGIYRG